MGVDASNASEERQEGWWVVGGGCPDLERIGGAVNWGERFRTFTLRLGMVLLSY